MALEGEALQHAARTLRGDREIVGQALKQSGGQALLYAADDLRGDRELVLRTVQEFDTLLPYEHATEELKEDSELMRAAMASVSSPCIGLKVALLSGRSCSAIIHSTDAFDQVLKVLAKKLNQDVPYRP